MSEKHPYSKLLAGYVQGILSAEERRSFFELFNEVPLNPELEDLLLESYNQNIHSNVWPEEFRRKLAARLAEKITGGESEIAKTNHYGNLAVELRSPDTRVNPRDHKVRIMHRWAWAAAAIIILTTGAYLWTFSVRKDKTVNFTSKHIQPDILPGGEHATLTLADGRNITLDNATNGELARQGNVKITKLSNGQIVYDLKGQAGNDVLLNTLSTPNGGQYQVILPDGTKVWLNASSSITYPSAFVGNKRQVKIKGEVYFEVAKNKLKPFIVDVDEKTSVQVLGTSFNINSYKGEENIRTTLIEGSVKIDSSVILKPGQQAVLNAGTSGSTSSSPQPTILKDVNLAQILAWKNGIFDFTGADLKTVMRQLERWYDIRVEYKSTMSNITFQGRMYRNVKLSDVLEVLQKMGVRFELNGKTLTVL